MTRAEYDACIRDLNNEMEAAEASGDQDRILGTTMAIDAFLSCVRLPPPDVTIPPKPRTAPPPIKRRPR